MSVVWKIGRTACASAAVMAGGALLVPSPASAEDFSALEYSPYEFAPPKNTGKVWKVYKAAWDQSDEEGYGHFVQAIGRSNCTTLAACLNNPANPYRSDSDPELNGDCADMAYILRAYYAWKNGLPFSFQNAMRTVDRSGEDLRYSSNGNIVAGRRAIRNVTNNAHAFLRSIGGQVSTAMFRTHPETGAGANHDDFYPVEITRDAVKPGVIAYDIFGHVGIVYEILDDGRVLVIAAHPDQSVTRSTYGPNFMRSKPALGAGLKAWRPIRVEGAKTNADGSITGGRLAAAKNDELDDFSLEQYLGTHPDPGGTWHYGEFRHQDRSLKYYDFVRRRLASPNFKYNPVDELRFGLETICGSLRARKYAVDSAVTMGLHLKPHPKKLPPNIYGTYGEWEDYSTPSRDARLKVSFIELRRDIQKLVEDVDAGEPGVIYEGNDLAGDLIGAFNEENDACTFTYWRSDKSRVRLNISHSMARLFDFSFNPYLCPERRWGASGVEFETCTDDEAKSQWYNALRFLRYQAERTYDVRMDFTLDQLKPPMVAAPEEGGLGVEAPADADLRRYLYSLNEVVVAAGDPGPIKATPVSNEGEDEFLLPEWHYRLNEERLKKIENLRR